MALQEQQRLHSYRKALQLQRQQEKDLGLGAEAEIVPKWRKEKTGQRRQRNGEHTRPVHVLKTSRDPPKLGGRKNHLGRLELRVDDALLQRRERVVGKVELNLALHKRGQGGKLVGCDWRQLTRGGPGERGCEGGGGGRKKKKGEKSRQGGPCRVRQGAAEAARRRNAQETGTSKVGEATLSGDADMAMWAGMALGW